MIRSASRRDYLYKCAEAPCKDLCDRKVCVTREFGISMDESYARYEEGIRQVERLLTEENVTDHGQFHSFDDVTSLPRPTQKPRPNFYLAAVGTPASFERAGQMGYWLMAIPGVWWLIDALLIPGMVRERMSSSRPANGIRRWYATKSTAARTIITRQLMG